MSEKSTLLFSKNLKKLIGNSSLESITVEIQAVLTASVKQLLAGSLAYGS